MSITFTTNETLIGLSSAMLVLAQSAQVAQSTGPVVWVMTVSAAVLGAMINVLMAAQKEKYKPIDLWVAGLLSIFAGLVVSSVIAQALATWIPAIESAGQVSTAGLCSLLGAHYLKRVLHSLIKEDKPNE